jgi:hypothetical protein
MCILSRTNSLDRYTKSFGRSESVSSNNPVSDYVNLSGHYFLLIYLDCSTFCLGDQFLVTI